MGVGEGLVGISNLIRLHLFVCRILVEGQGHVQICSKTLINDCSFDWQSSIFASLFFLVPKLVVQLPA